MTRLSGQPLVANQLDKFRRQDVYGGITQSRWHISEFDMLPHHAITTLMELLLSDRAQSGWRNE